MTNYKTKPHHETQRQEQASQGFIDHAKQFQNISIISKDNSIISTKIQQNKGSTVITYHAYLGFTFKLKATLYAF